MTIWSSPTRTPSCSAPTRSGSFAPKYGDSLLYEHHTTSLVFNDPPAHTRVRRLIMGALVAARHRRDGARPDRAGRPAARRACGERQGRTDRRLRLRDPGSGDRNLLDVPMQEREPLRDWSLAILGALEPVIDAEAFARGNRAVEDFSLIWKSWSSVAAPNRQPRSRRADPSDPGRG